MIEFVEVLNKSEWNGFIEESGLKTSFFQSFEWGLFEKSIGKDVAFYAIKQNEQIAAIMSIVFVKAKRGNYLHVRNGPVLDWENVEIRQEVMSFLKKHAKNRGCDFIRISPMINSNEQNKQLFKKLGFIDCQMHDVDAEVTWMLDLQKSDDEIQSEMRKNTRYYINRARKDGVTIEKSEDVADIDKFWPIFEDTVKRQKWTAYPYNYIKKEFEMFVKDGRALLMLAKYQEKYIAGSIFIYFNGIASYHHSGSLTDYRKIPAPYLIQWESILEAKARGMKKYNFFGIARTDDEKHPWAGLTFFKKGFGGYQDENLHAQDLPLKPKYWITHFYEKFERWKRGY